MLVPPTVIRIILRRQSPIVILTPLAGQPNDPPSEGEKYFAFFMGKTKELP